MNEIKEYWKAHHPVGLFTAVLAIAILSTGCASLQTPQGHDFIEGRVRTLSFLIVKELPNEAPVIAAASDLVYSFAAREDISVGRLTALLEKADIKELNTEYAPILINEILGWYEFTIANLDGKPESKRLEEARTFLKIVSRGLRDGIEEWEEYLDLMDEDDPTPSVAHLPDTEN